MSEIEQQEIKRQMRRFAERLPYMSDEELIKAAEGLEKIMKERMIDPHKVVLTKYAMDDFMDWLHGKKRK